MSLEFNLETGIFFLSFMEYWTFLQLFLLFLLSDCTFAQVLLKLKLNRIIISKIVLHKWISFGKKFGRRLVSFSSFSRL